MNKSQLLEVLAQFEEGEAIAAVIHDCLPLREEPQDKRRTAREKIYVDEMSIYVEVGFYDDGRPCEVFLTAGKEGHAIRDILCGLATVISISMQHGVPLSQFPMRGNGNQLTGQGSRMLEAVFNTVEELCTDASRSSWTSRDTPPTSHLRRSFS